MRKAWDSFRWPFVAAFHIAWWIAKGAPHVPDAHFSRWATVKTSWRIWRSHIMYPHEKDKYSPIAQIIAELRK